MNRASLLRETGNCRQWRKAKFKRFPVHRIVRIWSLFTTRATLLIAPDIARRFYGRNVTTRLVYEGGPRSCVLWCVCVCVCVCVYVCVRVCVCVCARHVERNTTKPCALTCSPVSVCKVGGRGGIVKFPVHSDKIARSREQNSVRDENCCSQKTWRSRQWKQKKKEICQLVGECSEMFPSSSVFCAGFSCCSVVHKKCVWEIRIVEGSLMRCAPVRAEMTSRRGGWGPAPRGRGPVPQGCGPIPWG